MKRDLKRYLAIFLGTIGLFVDMYMFKVIGDIGLSADETGASGDASFQWLIALAGSVAVVISIILLIRYSIEKR
jgi:hypothetical protein